MLSSFCLGSVGRLTILDGMMKENRSRCQDNHTDTEDYVCTVELTRDGTS